MNDHFSIIWGTRQLVKKQLLLYVASAVKQLRGCGLKAGDRVAICDDNSVEYVVLLLALWQLKAVAVPISPRWPDKTVAAYAAKVSARQPLCGPDIKRCVGYDARQHFQEQSWIEPQEEQEATIIATSGSSGEPKAALHAWGSHYYSAKGSNEVIPLSGEDRWVLALPLYHISGMAIVVRCLLSGAGLVVAGDEPLAETIERCKATHISLVSTQLQRLLADRKTHAPLRSLKCILLGGSSMPPALIEESVKLGLNIYLTYGLTEMASQVATGRVQETFMPCSKVLPYRQMAFSEQGEILVKGQVMFKGYVSGGKLHLPMVEHAGSWWFPTGDIGRLDENGCLTVSGRCDSMFISGGENIYPEEIEKVLLSIEGISQAIVVPKQDGEFGQRPIAFIQFAAEPLPEEYLVRRLASELPRFKIPVAFFPWPEHLMNQGIKIARREFLKTLPRR